MPDKVIDSTTQLFLDIFDITNNMVIMKDGTASVVLTVDAMNFGLLAEEEQDSIMYAYAGLLNSLNYPIQIMIRSQTKDVTGYLNLLREREDASPNRQRQKRIRKYREFVGDLIRERNVLDKKFYVVIPAQPIELGILPPSSVLPGKGSVNITSIDRNIIIEKAKNLLEPKRDHLVAQFARIGLYSRQLETQEIIQLFYLSYNPEASEGQQIGESNSYTAPLVTARMQGNIMNDTNVQTPTTTAAENSAAPTQPSMPSAPASPQPTTATTPPSAPATAPAAPTTTPMTPDATPSAPSMEQSMPTTPSQTATENTTSAPTTPPQNSEVPKEDNTDIKHAGDGTMAPLPEI